MGYYYEDEPCEMLDDFWAEEAEWRDMLNEQGWEYVYRDGEWEYSEYVADDCWEALEYYEGDFNW
jgi:hypothetical protein